MAINIRRSFWSAVRGLFAGLMAQSTTDPDAAVAIQAEEADGALYVKAIGAKLPVAGAAPSTVIGTSGRLNKDVTLTINTGKTVVAHPLVHGVSVIGANGAAAAVSALGNVVTLTAKNDGTTTVTAMNVLIAASPSVSALIAALSGTGTDTFSATFSVAETPLWESGTIPANALMILNPDGHFWPAEEDSTGGIKTSASSLHYGEGGTVPPLCTIRRGTRASVTAEGNIAAAAGSGTLLEVTVRATTAGVVTIYDNTAESGNHLESIACPISDTRGSSPNCSYGTGIYVGFDATFAGEVCLTFVLD